jgi:hypothetical protein
MAGVINIVEMEPEYFGVQVAEGDVTTSHRVRVTDGFVDDLQLGAVDRARIVDQTIAFLLDRVPPTSIPDELELDDIVDDHPDYYDELRARLAT